MQSVFACVLPPVRSVRSDTSSTDGVESSDNSTSDNSQSQADKPETDNLSIIDKHGDVYTLSKEPVNVRTYQYGTSSGLETMYEYHITADTVITLPDIDQVYEVRSILVITILYLSIGPETWIWKHSLSGLSANKMPVLMWYIFFCCICPSGVIFIILRQLTAAYLPLQT